VLAVMVFVLDVSDTGILVSVGVAYQAVLSGMLTVF
jgi:hypothetical protein